MVQVEVAGPRQPDTYPIAPNMIRHMATHLMNVCSRDDTHQGGFITDSLENMAGWLTSPEGELDKPMRMSRCRHPPLISFSIHSENRKRRTSC